MTATHQLAATVHWIEAAMIIFMVVFLAIVARVVLRRRSYRRESRIPLEDDTIMTPRDGAPPSDRPHD